MSRRSPRFIAVLLWIVIALLPIRALASAVMSVMMSGLPVSEVSAPAQAAAPVAATALPSHAAMADAADDASAGDMTHTCSLCDLCHSSVTVAPQPPVLAPSMHEPQPLGASPAEIEPRAPGGLFRPPRTSLV